MEEFKCRYETHENEPILGFCINQNCLKTTQFCFKCLSQVHKDHPDDCLRFHSLNELLNKYIEIHNEILNFYQDIQIKLKHTLEILFKKMDQEITILKEIDQNLINRSYLFVKQKILWIKQCQYKENLLKYSKYVLKIIASFLNDLQNTMETLKQLAKDNMQMDENNIKIAEVKKEQELKINKRKQKAHQLYKKGRSLFDNKQYKEALIFFEDSLKQDDSDEVVYICQGNSLQYLNLNQESIECYDNALKLNPNNSDVLNNKGNALQNLNFNQEAIECYDKALQIQQLPLYMKNKADALIIIGKKEESITWYQNAKSVGFNKDKINSILKSK
ncbi:unnamed protein product [Paramecium sonneborni]|uniref:Tetratricopeptide repeat protein n=1 Tax=Paramecium sonneborni TaxID=65129 RepID=A0A8S1RN68_9CILI|nr:unnamed protein product [Paramecium sonneborni]